MTMFYRTLLRGDEEIEVSIKITSWGSAPIVSGPPENCDPGEPMECEVVGASNPVTGLKVTLTDAEIFEAEEEFLGNPPEYEDFLEFGDYPDPDDLSED